MYKPPPPVYTTEARPGANTRTPEQVREQQRADAEKTRQARTTSPGMANLIASAKQEQTAAPTANKPTMPAAANKPVAAPTAGTQVTAPAGKTSLEIYLEQATPPAIAGRLIKFSKEGQFVTRDDGTPIDPDTDFIFLAPYTMAGWIKFNGDGMPPDRVMGLICDGFIKPKRDALPDNDKTQWPTDLSGEPDDPWKEQINLVLQNAYTRELFTFSTMTKTGRRAADNLLHHYQRMLRTHPDELPVVRLKPGGYQDKQWGWVPTPVFAVVGRVPSNSTAKPDTSTKADLDDEIPW
jgi:hypothetical protein